MIKGVLLDLYGAIFEYGDMGQAEADAWSAIYQTLIKHGLAISYDCLEERGYLLQMRIQRDIIRMI